MNGVAAAPQPVTLITGASSGIGAALAHVFARNGHRVVLIARREQKLVRLADEIAAAGRARPLTVTLDLARADAAAGISAVLAANGMEPQYVVNNAGFGLFGEAAQLDRAEQLAMIDLNTRVLVDLSLAFVDSLARHRGGILNLGSVASFLPGPGMAVYYATKAFVLSFSESLHQELAGRGIRVTVLCPGPVPTEFQDRAGIRRLPGARMLTLSADEVAAKGYAGLMQGRRLVVPGLANAMLTQLPRILPRGFFLRQVAREQLKQSRRSKSS
jgi:uncharacterized protein